MLELALGPGVHTIVGGNGQGKTNTVEAIDYLSRLSSHRVASDTPLVRQHAMNAVVKAAVVRVTRRAVLEIEINPGRANRARLNGSPLPKARDLVGILRTVIFAPDDLMLIKGDPSERRRFLDDQLVQSSPRYLGIKADYERVLKQRNSLLRSVSHAKSAMDAAKATLEVWDERLIDLGAQLMYGRAGVVASLEPQIAETYDAVATGSTHSAASVKYRPKLAEAVGTEPTVENFQSMLTAELNLRRKDEFIRGVTLVGPHRDEVLCELGGLPVKGYSSHGETWSFALALRLASFEALSHADLSGDDDPVLILDDVFAELDSSRREALAMIVADTEQVLVTAAVPDDVPEALRGNQLQVAEGVVSRESTGGPS